MKSVPFLFQTSCFRRNLLNIAKQGLYKGFLSRIFILSKLKQFEHKNKNSRGLIILSSSEAGSIYHLDFAVRFEMYVCKNNGISRIFISFVLLSQNFLTCPVQ